MCVCVCVCMCVCITVNVENSFETDVQSTRTFLTKRHGHKIFTSFKKISLKLLYGENAKNTAAQSYTYSLHSKHLKHITQPRACLKSLNVQIGHAETLVTKTTLRQY